MATSYCDEDDVTDRLGSAGVTLRTDDLPPDTLGRAVERASARVDLYCLRRYAAAQLAASVTVRELAAALATYYLCTRRGNPPPAPVAEAYEEARELLKLVQTGALALPDAAPRKAAAPALRNVAARLWPTPHPRVQRRRSTGTAEGYSQRVDYSDPLQWSDWQV